MILKRKSSVPKREERERERGENYKLWNKMSLMREQMVGTARGGLYIFIYISLFFPFFSFKKKEEGSETYIRRSSKVIWSLRFGRRRRRRRRRERKRKRERVGAKRGEKQLVGCELSSIGLPETVRNGHSSSRALKKASLHFYVCLCFPSDFHRVVVLWMLCNPTKLFNYHLVATTF